MEVWHWPGSSVRRQSRARTRTGCAGLRRHRLGRIDSLELAEMLELVEAAEMWAALEMAEGYEIGLFRDDLPDTENVDYRQGNGWWKSKRGN